MNSKAELTIGAIPADNIAATEEDSEEQRNFRLRYAQELVKKRQPGVDNYYGADELLEERKKVNQQQMKTPGRKGETIKQEEIDKEMVRRRSTR
jgi:hypothetical protein